MNYTKIFHFLIGAEECIKDYFFPDWKSEILEDFRIENNVTRQKSNLKTPSYF
jgi:hypothetical protein